MNDLITINKEISPVLGGNYPAMLDRISTRYPALKQDTEAFYKTQSQFMDNMLTVNAPTELRNLRQILAEIQKSKMALQEAYFANKKKAIEIKQKRLFLESATDLDAELLEVEIAELQSQIANTEDYMKGAIRKISAYMAQYDSILAKLGKTELAEEDFEEDEERYHIMRAFEQGLCAARSHNGWIDEGNQIYLFQIGINGMVAQAEVERYLEEEQKIIESGKEPAHEMTTKFLEYCARKFKGCSGKYAERRGMTLLDRNSLNKQITED
jgi:hypothetical protein